MTLYRRPKNDPTLGALRCKTWKTLPGMDVAPDNPLWEERCRQYWTLQGRLYGWKMSAFTMAYDNELGMVSTYCCITEVLPGERTEEFWRVPVESAQLQPLVHQ